MNKIKDFLKSQNLNWKYSLGWLIWILGFGVLEYRAIKDKDKGDTLSEHVWSVVGTKTAKKHWVNWVFRIGLGGLFAWLIPHFATGWNF